MSLLRCGQFLRASSPWRGHLLDRLSVATRILPERMQIRAAAAAAKEAMKALTSARDTGAGQGARVRLEGRKSAVWQGQHHEDEWCADQSVSTWSH